MRKLKVWWIPQVPGEAFEVLVESVEEGVKIMGILAKYDAFQFEQNIKPDYSNSGGLMMFDNEGYEWEDWYDESSGEDNPEKFVKEGDLE